MYNTLTDEQPLLGPLKVYGASKPGQVNGNLTGWFYPLYVTRKEAIEADLEKGGLGIYNVITFYNIDGEFYLADKYGKYGELKDPLIYTLHTGSGAENPFEKIQNRLSILIESQLPEFVQTDYGMFITFIKAYYEFLEQTTQAQELLQNLSKYADIDETSELLINKFFLNYANDATKTSISDNRFLIKKISSRKGTEDSFRILFNILYKETIEFFYPYDIVLKPSSGKWDLPKSLKVKQTDNLQNIFDFENTEIQGSISKATAVVNKVQKINLGNNDVYEFILDPHSIKNYFLKDEKIIATKSVLLNNVVDKSNLSVISYPVLSKIDIIDGKLGYEKGTPIKYIIDNSGVGLYASAKITGVNQYGTITSIEIENSGIGYSSNTTIVIDPPTQILRGKYTITNGIVTIEFPTNHSIKKNTILKVEYLSDGASDPSPIKNTSHKTKVLSIPNVRSIRFKYPGY